MKRFVLACCIVLPFLQMSCSKPEPGEVAAQAAMLYYDHLLQGRYGEYVAGMYFSDSIPENYRSQLVDNAKMFVVQQKNKRKGIKDIQKGQVVCDTARHTANVFLVLTYGDGDSEQVLVPMIESGGVWYMR